MWGMGGGACGKSGGKIYSGQGITYFKTWSSIDKAVSFGIPVSVQLSRGTDVTPKNLIVLF